MRSGRRCLTQYCNVVFLVGAAWMPLGIPLRRRLGPARSTPEPGRSGLGAGNAGARRRPRGRLPVGVRLGRLRGRPERSSANPPGRTRRIALAWSGLGLLFAYGVFVRAGGRPNLARLRPDRLRRIRVERRPDGGRSARRSASLAAWSGRRALCHRRPMAGRERGSTEASKVRLLLGLLAWPAGWPWPWAGSQLIPTLEFIERTTRGSRRLVGV